MDQSVDEGTGRRSERGPVCVREREVIVTRTIVESAVV